MKFRCSFAGVGFGILFLLLVLSGCASTGRSQDRSGPADDADPVTQVGEGGPDSGADRPPIDDEVMYQVFAAELAGTDGDFATAADAYLEAALLSSDPEVAERATRVAFAASAWQQAAMAGTRWAELAPDSLEAQESAAVALLRVEDYSAAEVPLGNILELSNDDPAAGWASVAGLLSGAANPDKANAVLNALLAQHDATGQVDALMARGRLAVRSGDVETGRELAAEALVLEPERPDLYVWAGRLELGVGNMNGALDYFAGAWRLAPEDVVITQAYAELLARSGDMGGAREVLTSLPESPESLLTQIAYAIRAGDLPSANELYEGFDDMSWESREELAYQAARAAELLERPEEAIAWYEHVQDGDHVLESYVRRAWLKASLGDVQAAQNILATLRVQNDPVLVTESYLAESQILRDHGDPEGAYEALSIGLDSLGDSVDLRYSRALLAVELNQIADAESDLRALLLADPNNPTVLNALGYTLADRTDRYEEAETLIAQAYALQPGEASILDSMGWVAFRQGRLDEAVDYLRAAFALDLNPEIAAHLGEVLWVRGNHDQAREIWRQGLSADAENRILQDTLRRYGVSP